MCYRKLVIAGAFSVAVGSVQAQLLPGGYTAVSHGDLRQTVAGKETRLRRRHTARLLLTENTDTELTLSCLPVGKYSDPLNYRVQSDSGRIVTEGSIPRGESGTVRITGAAPGLLTIDLDAGANSSSIRTESKHLFYEASDGSPLAMVYHAPRLYFWVPPRARNVDLHVRGGGKAEAAAFEVLNGDGRPVARSDTRTEDGRVSVPVPDRGNGGAWSIVFSKLAGVTFEDFSLAIGGDAAPFVAESPERLALPALHTYARVQEGQAEFGVRVNAGEEVLHGSSLAMTIENGVTGEVLHAETVTTVTPGKRGHSVDTGDFLKVTVEAQLLDARGQLILGCSESLATAHGQLFEEIPNVETHDRISPAGLDTQRGYAVFARAEPGDVRPNSHPRPSEVTRVVSAVVTPGEYETLYFALFPLRDAASATVGLGAFRDADGKRLPGMTTDLRWVRCWPQRSDWRSTTFHIIPELLEKRDCVPLRKHTPQQLAVIVSIPQHAAAGTYSAPVNVEIDGAASEALTLRFEVLPFKLKTPPGIVWGLYPDTARWKTFSEGQIEAEMRDFRAHGINALMMYPQWDTEWSMHDGALQADFTEFRKRMRLYRKVGLGGPMVASIQAGERLIRKVMDAQTGTRNDDAEDVYRQFLQLLKSESAAGDWPQFCLHSVDEPHGGEKLAAALRTLRAIKGLGLRTFNTCYGKAVRETLDPYLDFRCYNNIGFLSFPDAEAAEALRRETLTAGDTFWWYGTGCYTNRNFIQDGNVIANRFMGGFHFWRTQATGCWAWTFQRAKGNVYDDFDGTSQREHKEACIAYPTPDGKSLIPTLQWEGIREGVDDYRYVYTLTELVREARQSSGAARVAAAAAAESELDAILAAMPWTCRDGAFTNADANRTRNRIARLCAALDSLR